MGAGLALASGCMGVPQQISSGSDCSSVLVPWLVQAATAQEGRASVEPDRSLSSDLVKPKTPLA